MTAPAVTTRRFPTSSGRRGKAEPDARALVTAIRSSGFDLRRTMFVTFVVSVGDSRDAAFAMLHTDRQARWHTSLYGDDSGWVVRVSHSCRLTADKLTACLLRVNGLAAAGGGSVREVTVDRHQRCGRQHLAGRVEEDASGRADVDADGVAATLRPPARFTPLG